MCKNKYENENKSRNFLPLENHLGYFKTKIRKCDKLNKLENTPTVIKKVLVLHPLLLNWDINDTFV